MDKLDKQHALEYYLEEKLAEMQTEKAERLKNVEPNWCTKKEIYDAIIVDAKAILNKMFHENKVKVHKTIHAPIHDYVELVKED
jgi:hypothetical protein